jgi:hypothetical protein
MKWERLPWFEGEISSDALAITEAGIGFVGGYLFDSDEDFRQKNYQKSMAMHKSIIQKTTDDWKTRDTVFQGKGEIVAFFRTGNGRMIAQNSQVSMQDLHESGHFITWENGEWKDVSNLPFRVIGVWGSDSPWLLAVGYPQDGFNPVFNYVSSDGAHTWKPVSLGGFNPLQAGRDSATVLFPDGIFYRALPMGLQRLDLKTAADSGHWEKVRDLPPSFRPSQMAKRDNALLIFGSLSDKDFALWFTRADGTGADSLFPCKGIPAGFSARRLVVAGPNLYLVGTVSIFEKGEMRGLDHYILKSANTGAAWQDLDLPLNGSLQAVDFGADGRVWAMAAGNRMQVLHEP